MASVERVNHDTFIFCLCHNRDVLPPPPTSPVWHVTLFATVDGKMIERDYTPISAWSEWKERRQIRLLIKIYPDGAMTQFLLKNFVCELEGGMLPAKPVLISAPHDTLVLPHFGLPDQPAPSTPPRHVVLFAAGTGIVPMLQVLQAAYAAPSGIATVSLLYAVRSPADLLCWADICALHTSPDSPSLEIWLALSTTDALPESNTIKGATLAGVLQRRIDKELVETALAGIHASMEEGVIRAVVSGPHGFFDAMQDAFPSALRASTHFVNLDD